MCADFQDVQLISIDHPKDLGSSKSTVCHDFEQSREGGETRVTSDGDDLLDNEVTASLGGSKSPKP